MEHFRDKVAVITGGASGIGLAIARALIKRGSKVIIADINTEDLDSAALELGSNATVFTCNVADLSSVKTLAENCWTVHGHVDLVFNNAGVISKSAAVVDTDFNDFKWQVRNGDSLQNALREILEMPDEHYADRQQRGRRYIENYLNPVTPERLSLFLPRVDF